MDIIWISWWGPQDGPESFLNLTACPLLLAVAMVVINVISKCLILVDPEIEYTKFDAIIYPPIMSTALPWYRYRTYLYLAFIVVFVWHSIIFNSYSRFECYTMIKMLLYISELCISQTIYPRSQCHLLLLYIQIALLSLEWMW